MAITSVPRRRSVVIGAEGCQIAARWLCWDSVSAVAGSDPAREAHPDEGGRRASIGARRARRGRGRGAGRARCDAAPARPLGAVLDRRGDLRRHRRTPPERHPGGAAPGRLAAAVLPAAARLDGALRLVAERDARALRRLCHRVRAGGVVGGGALRHVGRPRRRRTDGARPLHRPLRRRDAHVLAPAPAGRARVRRLPARLRAAPARPRGDLRAAPRAVAVLARVGRVPRPGRGAGLARARRRRPAPARAGARRRARLRRGRAALRTLGADVALPGRPHRRPVVAPAHGAVAGARHHPGLERAACRAPAPSGRGRGARDRGVAQRPPRAPRSAGDGGHRGGDAARSLRLLALRDARVGPSLPGRGARAARAAGRLGARPPRPPRPVGRARGGPLRLARPAHRRDALAQEQRRARRPRARARAAARHARLLHAARAGARARARAARRHALRDAAGDGRRCRRHGLARRADAPERGALHRGPRVAAARAAPRGPPAARPADVQPSRLAVDAEDPRHRAPLGPRGGPQPLPAAGAGDTPGARRSRSTIAAVLLERL